MDKFSNLAIALAETSEHSQYKVGSVLVSNKSIISVGVNTLKSHPYQKIYNKYRNFNVEINHFLHAETDAILKYRRMRIELPKLKIYIARIRKDGTIVPGFPCPACYQLILDNNIREIIFSTHDDFNQIKL